MRLWISPDATVVDLPAGRGGARLRLSAEGTRIDAIDDEITLAPHDPFGALSAAGRDESLRAIPGLCAAVELPDDQIAALIEVRKGALFLARGAWPERGREWSEAAPIGAQKPLKVAWPRGVLWSDMPPRSRARKPVARPGVLTLTATAYGLCVACSHTGLVYVVRSGVIPDLALQVPIAEGARLDALATREGALITLVLSSGVGALVHFDERGLDLGWRGGSGLTPAQLLARDRLISFDHGDDEHLSLLALPDLSPVGERLPLGFFAREAAVTADGLAFALASETHLVEGRLDPRGLVLTRRCELRPLLDARTQPPPQPPLAASVEDLALAVDMQDLADALFDDAPSNHPRTPITAAMLTPQAPPPPESAPSIAPPPQARPADPEPPHITDAAPPEPPRAVEDAHVPGDTQQQAAPPAPPEPPPLAATDAHVPQDTEPQAAPPAPPEPPPLAVADIPAPQDIDAKVTSPAPLIAATAPVEPSLAPEPAPLDDIEALEVESIEIVPDEPQPIPVARTHGKSASNRPPPPPPPRRRDDPPAFALGVLSQEPLGRWQAAVGGEFELLLSIRSAGGAGRGLHLVVSGEALTRGLIALTHLRAEDTLAPIARAEAGVVRVELPELEHPAGFTYPFDPAPTTPEARSVAEAALAATHRELRLRGRGLRPGSGLLALSLSVPGSSAPPLRWIRPLAVAPP